MRRSTLRNLAGACAAALALAACGGGGGGIDGTGGGGGGNGGGGNADGLAYGTITGFGSVWVNGVRFNTDNSTFRIDDNPGGQDDLRVGMVVRIDGSIDNATAATVTVDDAVKGYVESVIDANRIVVMGQTVLLDNQTQRSNFSGTPAIGNYVEVHGLSSADGQVTAGYIERKTTLATPPFVVKGLVKNHDTGAQTFVVGTLTVRYAGATTNDMPAGSWNGLLVDAKGSTCAGNPVCGQLTASKVEPGGANVSSIAKAEVEGFVASGTSASFLLGAQQVVTNGSTVFEGGLPEDVVPGAKLEAEGPISNGVLTATKVSFRDNLRFEGDVASFAGGALTLAGLPGITVQVNSLTELDDGLPAVGNHVRIKARPGPNGTVLAMELEVRSQSSDVDVELQGPIAGSGTARTVLGITIDLNGISQFRDLNDGVLSRDAFSAAAPAGTLVKVKGQRSGGTVDWQEIELED